MSNERKIHWIPLESNPDVFNRWASKAGLDLSEAQFTDIYSLDDELLSIIPQPVKAVVVLFPDNQATLDTSKDEDCKIKNEGQHPIDSSVFWMVQTIVNACGTMALFHALANTGLSYGTETPLGRFLEECKDKTPLERAKLLETTDLFANIHLSAAISGQSVAPPAEEEPVGHFTCFIQAEDPTPHDNASVSMRLIELDGGRVGPIDRGPSVEFLEDVARFVKEQYVARNASLEFSMMALCPPVA